MAKVTINGEVFGFDRSRKPLAEMLALEKALGVPYAHWERDLLAGSARALAGFVWLVWRRDGREVNFADIESGEIEINLADFDVEEDPEPEDGEAGPTPAAAGNGGAASPPPPPAGSGASSTGRGRGSSRSPASASAPGRSGSST